MVLQLRQDLRLTQQLIMTPQLQMAIKLLQLNRMELVDRISQELEENPALEEVNEISADEHAQQVETLSSETLPGKEVTSEEKILDDIDWSSYYDEYYSRGRTRFETETRDSPRYETFVAQKESLKDYLLWQLLLTSPTEEEKQIGSHIVGNLNRDGYLDVPVDEIARLSGFSADEVERVLSLLQTFDPSGICSRNLGECLLVQARRLGLDDTIIISIITDHIKHLENKNYMAICRALKIGI